MLRVQIVENPSVLPSVSINLTGRTIAELSGGDQCPAPIQSITIVTPRSTDVTLPILNDIIKLKAVYLVPMQTIVEVQTGITVINFGVNENYDLVDIPIRQIFSGYNFCNPFQNMPPVYDPFMHAMRSAVLLPQVAASIVPSTVPSTVPSSAIGIAVPTTSSTPSPTPQIEADAITSQSRRLAAYIFQHPNGVPAGIITKIKDGVSIKQRMKMFNYVRSVLGNPTSTYQEVEKIIECFQNTNF